MISNKFKMSAAAVAFVGLTAAFTPASDAEAGGRHDRYNNHNRHSDRNYGHQTPRYQPPRYYQPLPYPHRWRDRDNTERYYDQERRAYEDGRRSMERQLFNELQIPHSGYYMPLPQYAPAPIYVYPPRGSIYLQIR